MRAARQDPFALDRRAVRSAANAAAASYDAAAVLQSAVREHLLERLDYVRLEPAVVLDLGAATGGGCAALTARYPDALVIGADIAERMLLAARSNNAASAPCTYLCADALALPLAADSVDLVFCNLLLPFCEPLELALREIKRVLSPGGLFNFATAGPDTLYELRDAWASIDPSPHVHRFPDMHDVGDAILAAGLAEPVLDTDYFTLYYRNVKTIMRELQACGAHNATVGRKRGLTGRGQFGQLQDAYEQFRDSERRLPVSCEIIYGQAWGQAPGTGVDAATGEARVPVDRIGRRSRAPGTDTAGGPADPPGRLPKKLI